MVLVVQGGSCTRCSLCVPLPATRFLSSYGPSTLLLCSGNHVLSEDFESRSRARVCLIRAAFSCAAPSIQLRRTPHSAAPHPAFQSGRALSAELRQGPTAGVAPGLLQQQHTSGSYLRSDFCTKEAKSSPAAGHAVGRGACRGPTWSRAAAPSGPPATH